MNQFTYVCVHCGWKIVATFPDLPDSDCEKCGWHDSMREVEEIVRPDNA